MDHAALVKVLQSMKGLPNEAYCFGGGQSLSARQNRVEGFTFQVLHHDVMDAVGIADLEGADHVGVVELSEQAGFALKAAKHMRLLRGGRGEDLQCNDLPQSVNRLVYAAHMTLADAVEDFVSAEKEVVGPAA